MLNSNFLFREKNKFPEIKSAYIFEHIVHTQTKTQTCIESLRTLKFKTVSITFF